MHLEDLWCKTPATAGGVGSARGCGIAVPNAPARLTGVCGLCLGRRCAASACGAVCGDVDGEARPWKYGRMNLIGPFPGFPNPAWQNIIRIATQPINQAATSATVAAFKDKKFGFAGTGIASREMLGWLDSESTNGRLGTISMLANRQAESFMSDYWASKNSSVTGWSATSVHPAISDMIEKNSRRYSEILTRTVTLPDIALPSALSWANIATRMAEAIDAGYIEDEALSDAQQYADEAFADLSTLLREDAQRIADNPEAQKTYINAWNLAFYLKMACLFFAVAAQCTGAMDANTAYEFMTATMSWAIPAAVGEGFRVSLKAAGQEIKNQGTSDNDGDDD